ncbi:MAG TPA: CRISPR-associated endonuclease Cas2 [Candidatus Brocadiia bacterium]|nr:CRISPR-associated endonuclease Cas2 [Candidatus Brocadiia bacterium]
MKSERADISGYKGMWLFTMFDLPVKTKQERKIYAQFRKELIKLGFSMLQFSVYARYFNCEERARGYRNQIKSLIPSDGQIRLLSVTDVQFGKMEIFNGGVKGDAEKPPQQLMLF